MSVALTCPDPPCPVLPCPVQSSPAQPCSVPIPPPFLPCPAPDLPLPLLCCALPCPMLPCTALTCSDAADHTDRAADGCWLLLSQPARGYANAEFPPGERTWNFKCSLFSMKYLKAKIIGVGNKTPANEMTNVPLTYSVHYCLVFNEIGWKKHAISVSCQRHRKRIILGQQCIL